MLNLAPLRYRDVFAESGGPIERLEVGEVELLGRRVCFANATLAAGLRDGNRNHRIFSNADATGVDPSPLVARCKAVSEALERWAHRAVLTSARRLDFGFEADPSSTGMAAFPGLLARQARPAAQAEATERFNLLHWWEGRLDGELAATRWPGVQALRLQSEAPGITAVLFQKTSEGIYAYGHAAGRDFAAACERAVEELARHAQVIRSYNRRAACAGEGTAPPELNFMERRARYFSTETGHAHFLARVRARVARDSRPKPQLAYDGPVPGPWTRYADVWRVAYAPPSRRYLDPAENFFFW